MQDRYFVEMPDGQRYGPADLPTLREWVAQGRLHPTSTLISESSGERLRADAVTGLFGEAGAAPPPFVGSGPSTGTPPPGTPPPGSAGPMSNDPPRKSRSTMLIVLVAVGAFGICFCGVFAAILFPVFAQARIAAKRTQGLSGVKQLATGIAIYSADFDDMFPLKMESASALQPALTKYVQDPLAFQSKNPVGGEILGDKRLAGQSMYSFDRPAQTIMLYDSLPWQDGRAPAAFVDTSARLMRHDTILEMLKRNPLPTDTPTE